MKPNVTVVAEAHSLKLEQAQTFAEMNGFEFRLKEDKSESASFEYQLHFSEEKIVLSALTQKKPVHSFVDFVSGAKAHRRKFGGGKGQSIAKAVGLNKAPALTVLDATAGMGGDAFVLASLGCTVTMIERSPIVRVLLEDGLSRAIHYGQEEDKALLAIVERMQLLAGDSLNLLTSDSVLKPQVVYLDPMFPARKKSAEVKKEMKFFHDIVGDDNDAAGLLDAALALAENRVVVKRPKIAPYLADREPSYQLLGKSGRFDIYTLKAFT